MVKNSTGGNKAKKFGRKHLGGDGGGMGGGAVRLAKDADELYAVVNKIYGGTADVKCIDGNSRIMVIRNKFKGRGKRDNILNNGTWVLVGRRSWEATGGGKSGKEKCDLLEVYNSNDINRLRQMDNELDWTTIMSVAQLNNDEGSGMDNDTHFVDAKTMEYEELMEKDISQNYLDTQSSNLKMSDSDSDFDIDDI